MVGNYNPCKNCIYHTLAEKKLLDKSVSFWCYKYNKMYQNCPDKIGAGIEASLNRIKNILQNWIKFLERSKDMMPRNECQRCGNPVYMGRRFCALCSSMNSGYESYMNTTPRWAKGGIVGKPKKHLLSGRPDRDEVINDDDILNVKIFAETFK